MSTLIGQRIRDLRIKQGLTQTELAKDIVTPSMISQIEAGKAVPSAGLLRKLAKRLDAPEDAFLIPAKQGEAASARMEVIRACLAVGRPEDAEALISETLANPAEYVELHYLRARALFARNQFREAASVLETAFQQTQAQESFDFLPELHTLRGDLFHAIGEYEIAAHEYRQGLLTAERRPGLSGGAETRLAMRLSETLLALGQDGESRIWATRASERMALGERSKHLAEEHLRSAIASLERGADGDALRLAAEARSLSDVVNWLKSSGSAVLLLARHFLREGDYRQASELLETAKQRTLLVASEHETAHLLLFESELAVATGDPETGVETAGRILGADIPASAETVEGLIRIGEAALRIGKTDIARDLAKKAGELVGRLKDLVAAGRACPRISKILFEAGDRELALKTLSFLSG